jgi:hypothetical protein
MPRIFVMLLVLLGPALAVAQGEPAPTRRPTARPTASRSVRAKAEAEYERIKADYPDTVDGQWKIAEWCREHHLLTDRKTHLERIIQLDPDHLGARRALGYQKQEGRWMTQAEIMTDRGYVLYRGRWKLPQEIKQYEEKKKETAAENQWIGDIRKWRSWLTDDRAEEALANLRAINDPFALKALKKHLAEEEDFRVRLCYVDAMARIATGEAVESMVEVALRDPAEEVRLTALDHLSEKQYPEATARFIQELRSKDNVIVNRAAVGLEHMDHPGSVPALIDALITAHKYKIVQGNPGITSTFSRSSPGAAPQMNGLSTGQSVTTVVQQIPNAAVRDALIKLTGVNYDFDVAQWKAWLQTRKEDASLDGRRD